MNNLQCVTNTSNINITVSCTHSRLRQTSLKSGHQSMSLPKLACTSMLHIYPINGIANPVIILHGRICQFNRNGIMHDIFDSFNGAIFGEFILISNNLISAGTCSRFGQCSTDMIDAILRIHGILYDILTKLNGPTQYHEIDLPRKYSTHLYQTSTVVSPSSPPQNELFPFLQLYYWHNGIIWISYLFFS